MVHPKHPKHFQLGLPSSHSKLAGSIQGQVEACSLGLVGRSLEEPDRKKLDRQGTSLLNSGTRSRSNSKQSAEHIWHFGAFGSES